MFELQTTHVLAAVAALVLGTLGCAEPREPLPAELAPALDSISGEAIAQHMRRLADDAMNGRGTGTIDHDAAADYVATRFTEIGLEPAGDDGDFLQAVPLLRADGLYEETHLVLTGPAGRVELEAEVDYVFAGDFVREAVELTAPLAYAGFGVVAQEPAWDDYAGIDVDGRIVVVTSGAPAAFPADVRAHFSSRREKARAAVERGAVGLLVVHSDEDERRYPWERLVRQVRTGAMRWLDEGGEPTDVRRGLFVEARLSRVGFERLLAAAGGASEPVDGARDVDAVSAAAAAGHPEAFTLEVALEARTATRHTLVESANVVARLEGSDPALAVEHIVVTAHLDHLGVGEADASGDAIYNGAYDNASGVAVLLELARALASLDRRPARSVLFVAVTAEEKGLLGSDYFVRHLPVPEENVVANLNLDMVMMLHPLTDVIGYGAGHSSLAAVLERAAGQAGLAVSPDPVPAAAVFVRSDQYSFVRRGIPALFAVPGFRGSRNGGRDMQAWLHDVYHSPADDLTQDFDFEAGAGFARFQALLLWHVAEAPSRPAWTPGDFFAP